MVVGVLKVLICGSTYVDLHSLFVVSLFLFFGICLQVESSSIVLVSPPGVKLTQWLSFYIHLKHSASAVIHFVKYKHQNSLVSQHKRV